MLTSEGQLHWLYLLSHLKGMHSQIQTLVYSKMIESKIVPIDIYIFFTQCSSVMLLDESEKEDKK